MKRCVNIGDQHISLTDKEFLYVENYLGKAKFNATNAAKLAEYSERSAYQQGYENLKKPDVKRDIKFKSAPVLEGKGITHELSLKELVAIAFGNLFDYFPE